MRLKWGFAMACAVAGGAVHADVGEVRQMIGFCAFDEAYALLGSVPDDARRAEVTEELRQARNREVVVWQTFEAARAAFDMGRKAQEADALEDAEFLYTDARRLFVEAGETTGCERGMESVDQALGVVDQYLSGLTPGD